MATKNEENSCLNTTYDILTIVISIADIITDIIVLISFYNNERPAFFAISLVILIIAQLCYAALFMWRYYPDISDCAVILLFIAIIPFGTVVSFLVYLTDDKESAIHKYLAPNFLKFHITDTLESQYSNAKHGKMTKWIINKFSKFCLYSMSPAKTCHFFQYNFLYKRHIGFIIEAGVEALPQSLLQIVAIVYYKEANYISIASIFLSMFSVMSKSLVFSQGIDIKTYIWTWLCIVVDFFGIFFMLTWVFYTNDTLLHPEFLDYFSIIGEIWFYKMMLSVSPCIILGSLGFIARWLPEMMMDMWRDYSLNCGKRALIVLLYLVGGTLFVATASFVGFIAIEIFCFSFVALIILMIGTTRWGSHGDKHVGGKVNGMLQFISKTSVLDSSGDRTFRIIASNQGLYEVEQPYYLAHLYSYIKKIDDEEGIKGVQAITMADLRANCSDDPYLKRWVKIYPAIIHGLKTDMPKCGDFEHALCCEETYWDSNFNNFVFTFGFWPVIIIAIPVFTLCKILQAVFPYIILGYLLYNGELFNVDLFQLVMLFTFIGLQVILFILTVIVMRIHFYLLWYIYPGNNYIYLKQDHSASSVLNAIDKWYTVRLWIPEIEKLLRNLYGEDIQTVIMDYYQSIELEIPP